MSTSQYCVSSDNFTANICKELTSLQQHEEFVDMTLAADGYFVKVHQIVVSLASPYLKELILSAPCPHPVVYLNKLSYPILCYILQYIYSGEVMVDKDSLLELIAAGKELRIKGLQDMELQENEVLEKNRIAKNNSSVLETNKNSQSERYKFNKSDPNQSLASVGRSFEISDDSFAGGKVDHHYTDGKNNEMKYSDLKLNENNVKLTPAQALSNSASSTGDLHCKTVQYTLTNQGHLQLILNRFMYHLNYCYKNSSIRSWRCVDAKTLKCPASVTTKNDIVVRRVSAHKHGFHDKKIMKKIQNGVIFSAIKDAEYQKWEDKNKPRNT